MNGISTSWLFTARRLSAIPTVLRTLLIRKSSSAADENLVRAAITPKVPTKLDSLVNWLINTAILHEPGRFIILEKPYGLGCLGYMQKNGGVFRSSRFDQRDLQDDEDGSEHQRSSASDSFTLNDALPFIAEYFKELNLSFCIGLKRYISGPVVLPASKRDFENIKKSVCRVDPDLITNGFHHKALVICTGRPVHEEGQVNGYATFQTVSDHSEYIFLADSKAKKRARSGKYAVVGSMQYKVIGSNYGCSLIDISFSKFSRHLPRLMLTELLCPVLGDSIYMRRIMEVDGAPKLVLPKDVYRARGHLRDISVLLKRLSLSQKDVYNQLPLYFHVYRSFFPRFGIREGDDHRTDLIACSPPPKHFLAMLECLELHKAAIAHLESVSEERIVHHLSGETRF